MSWRWRPELCSKYHGRPAGDLVGNHSPRRKATAGSLGRTRAIRKVKIEETLVPSGEVLFT